MESKLRPDKDEAIVPGVLSQRRTKAPEQRLEARRRRTVCDLLGCRCQLSAEAMGFDKYVQGSSSPTHLSCAWPLKVTAASSGV